MRKADPQVRIGLFDILTESDHASIMGPQLEAAAFSACIAEYRNVDVCVPPVREEPLVGLDACGNVADHRMGARKTQRRNGMERRERVGASLIENALEFCCGVCRSRLGSSRWRRDKHHPVRGGRRPPLGRPRLGGTPPRSSSRRTIAPTGNPRSRSRPVTVRPTDPSWPAAPVTSINPSSTIRLTSSRQATA